MTPAATRVVIALLAVIAVALLYPPLLVAIARALVVVDVERLEHRISDISDVIAWVQGFAS